MLAGFSFTRVACRIDDERPVEYNSVLDTLRYTDLFVLIQLEYPSENVTFQEPKVLHSSQRAYHWGL